MPETKHVMTPENQNLNTNTLFGKYELGRLLGCGAFAKVYHARDVQSGQSVAIKVINKKRISSSLNLVSNTKREISIMRKLNHPNIVKLHEVLATKTKIYFVMEFVKGGELFAKVAKGRFSEDLSRKYFQQLISAIGYCHARGVFHRDLKPENLLLDENGNLKVTDFGLSAVKDQVRVDGLLHTLCGTPAYVAPEILIKRGYDGARVDVWSCGVILFVLNAGYLPFNDPNLMALYKKIYRGDYRCPRWMSGELKRFLSRLMDTNPETRITVDEILEDPWFRKGLEGEIRFYDEEDKEERGLDSVRSLNAFDLISMSSGLDLSGFFDDVGNPREDWERFVSPGTAEKLMEKVEEIVTAQQLEVKGRKEWGLKVQGHNGKLVMELEVYRLTDEMVVVEVRRKGGDVEEYDEMWRGKIKPELVGSTSGHTTQVAGG